MAIGDTERAFCESASQDKVFLERYKKPWINQQGHFGLPDQAQSARNALETIFLDLGGNPNQQSSKRSTALPGDFIHSSTGLIIEIDEKQHFTSHRLHTFERYPSNIELGFDAEEFKELCRKHSSVADKYRQAKHAVAFGASGRQRQRAYYDALRDLAIPEMGLPPIIRVPAIDVDGHEDYRRIRDRLLATLQKLENP